MSPLQQPRGGGWGTGGKGQTVAYRTIASDIEGDLTHENTPPRVLHVLDSFELGGAQRVALNLVEWLAARGVPTAILAPEGALLERPRAGWAYFRSKGRPNLAEAAAAIDAFRPTVLHAHQRREALTAGLAGRMRGIPTVEHAHTLLPGQRFRSLSFRSRRIYAVSPDVARMVIEDYDAPAARVRVIPNLGAVDLIDQAPAPSSRLMVPDARWRVLGIGRMTEQKNPLRFVAVMARLNRIHPVAARWIGEGELLAPARRLADVLDAPVEFAGPSHHIEQELDRADALVMTSGWEGVPLVALESYARGRVVFATESSRVPVPAALRARYVVDDEIGDEAFARRIADTLVDGEVVASDAVTVHAEAVRRADRDAVFGPILEDYRALTRTRV